MENLNKFCVMDIFTIFLGIHTFCKWLNVLKIIYASNSVKGREKIIFNNKVYCF